MADQGKEGMGLLAAFSAKRSKPSGSSEPPTESNMTLDSEPDMDEDDSSGEHDAAFDAFASAAGIPPESQGAAKAALEQFVKACSRDYSSKGE